MCASSALSRCNWNASSLSCYPQSCRPVRCGVMTCACQATPLDEQPPWQVLRLDPSLAFSAMDVKKAFLSVSQELQPEKNIDCREQAGKTFMEARRSRDTLLMMASALARSDEKAMATVMMGEKIGQPAPAMTSLLRLGRGWMHKIKQTVKDKLLKMKSVFTKSISFYLQHPATFILGSILLQFIAISQF